MTGRRAVGVAAVALLATAAVLLAWASYVSWVEFANDDCHQQGYERAHTNALTSTYFCERGRP